MSFIYGYKIVSKPRTWVYRNGKWISSFEGDERLNSYTYWGIDREESWPEIEESYWTGRDLPDDLRRSYLSIIHDSNDFIGLKVTRSFEKLEKIRNYLVGFKKRKDVDTIVIRCKALGDREPFGVEHTGLIRWLGYEPFAIGEWSILLEGIIHGNHSMNHWLKWTNQYGLFDNADDCDRFKNEYKSLMETGRPEPIATDARLGIVCLQIGLLEEASCRCHNEN